MDENIIMFDDIEIEKYKFHKYKSLILIDNIDINKILVLSNKVLGKRCSNILLTKKMLSKLDDFAYFFQKRGHIEKILIKLDL